MIGKPCNYGSECTSGEKTLCPPPQKVNFPCKMCKGEHFLWDCPGIPRVLEALSQISDHPSSSTSGDHVNFSLLASDGMKKGKIKFPCRLCEGENILSFTFVLSWLKLQKFWKTWKFLNPNFLLAIRGFLMILPRWCRDWLGFISFPSSSSGV